MNDPAATESKEYKDLQRQLAECNRELRKLEKIHSRLVGLVSELLRWVELSGSRYCVGRKPVDDLRAAFLKE